MNKGENIMKNKIKKIVGLVLAYTILFNVAIPTYAEDTDVVDEQYELTIIENDDYFEDIESGITPRGKYITSGLTRMTEVSTGKVYMRVDINCVETVSSIQSTLTLQKLVSGTWTNVASKTVSVSDTNQMSKTISASGLASGGTYRTKSVTKVTPYSGSPETATGYSGSLILS